ncbi:MAG: GxxExxY protein [Bacteroidetes bacterium]|nr:GxxExxY protein [Bacteroidota bacterium]
MALLHQEKTEKIIKAFYDVYNALGYGFLERLYETALAIELTKRGFSVKRQSPIKVYYLGELIGEYCCDLIIDDIILIELKSVEVLAIAHKKQTINYLKATEMEVGLLLNFGEKPQIERFLFTNDKKPLLRKVLNP